MKRAVVTGLGFITSIGNSRAEVAQSLRAGCSGIEIHPELDRSEIPVKLAGTIKGFRTQGILAEGWELPPGLSIPRVRLRSMAPHGVYAYAAMQEAIADAGLPPGLVSHERTGVLCASSGSPSMLYRHADKMVHAGVASCYPLGLAQSVAGTLNFNLVAAFGIRGVSGGYVSACASSAQAFGSALDLIRLGRQDVVFVVGAEDCDLHSILPFASFRALTRSTDPTLHPCAFDRKRDGFVATGGASVLVLEEHGHALARGASVYAEAVGWGQNSDGYDVMMPEPNGEGLARAMHLALEDAGWQPGQIDYINAHATSPPPGDRAEMRALRQVFGAGQGPAISSTKSQTGHGLSLAGAMEAAFCCLAIKQEFMPGSINLHDPDPEAEGLNLLLTTAETGPIRVLSNSSGFGGTNVVLAFQRLDF